MGVVLSISIKYTDNIINNNINSNNEMLDSASCLEKTYGRLGCRVTTSVVRRFDPSVIAVAVVFHGMKHVVFLYTECALAPTFVPQASNWAYFQFQACHAPAVGCRGGCVNC